MPGQRSFRIAPGNWVFQGFIEDTLLTFTIDTAGFTHNYYPLITNFKETGSKIYDVYTQLKMKQTRTVIFCPLVSQTLEAVLGQHGLVELVVHGKLPALAGEFLLGKPAVLVVAYGIACGPGCTLILREALTTGRYPFPSLMLHYACSL